jgi:hypothetical protein
MKSSSLAISFVCTLFVLSALFFVFENVKTLFFILVEYSPISIVVLAVLKMALIGTGVLVFVKNTDKLLHEPFNKSKVIVFGVLAILLPIISNALLLSSPYWLPPLIHFRNYEFYQTNRYLDPILINGFRIFLIVSFILKYRSFKANQSEIIDDLVINDI